MAILKSLLFAFLLTALLTVSSKSQWTLIPTNTTTNFVACKFFNAQTGIITGQDINLTGKIFRTQDGGLNWTLVYNTPSDEIFECVSFINDQTGWAGGYTSIVYKTTNGGLNWTLLTNVGNGIARSIFFADALTGWIQTDNGIRKTTNGGSSWFIAGQSYPGSAMYFFNSNTGIVASYNNILKTTNGGSTFNIVYNPPPSNSIISFEFLNAQTGFASGGKSLLIKTTNAGTNWFTVSLDSVNPWSENFYKLTFVDENLGYACGEFFWGGTWGTIRYGILRKTTNGGINWTSISVSSNSFAYYDIKMTDGQTGYMVGERGYVYKTTNGGFIGIQPISSELPNHFSLSQNYPNPFNPSTKIKFDIARSAFTTIKVYDVLGREVASPVNELLKPGTYEIEFSATGGGSNLPSGVYFYKLVVGDAIGTNNTNKGNFTETKKMILLK